MHLHTTRASVLVATLLFGFACAPATTENASDGGSGGSTGSGGASGGSGGAGGASVPTYTKDVQPIFKAKCSPCHAGQTVAHHDIANNYADVNKDIESFDFDVCWKDTEQTMPKKVGECALLLIQNGRMPIESGCGSAMPLKPEACLSAAQIATVSAWVAAGMPQ